MQVSSGIISLMRALGISERKVCKNEMTTLSLQSRKENGIQRTSLDDYSIGIQILRSAFLFFFCFFIAMKM